MSREIFPRDGNHYSEPFQQLHCKRWNCLHLVSIHEYAMAVTVFDESVDMVQQPPANMSTHPEFMDFLCQRMKKSLEEKLTFFSATVHLISAAERMEEHQYLEYLKKGLQFMERLVLDARQHNIVSQEARSVLITFFSHIEPQVTT